MEKRRGRRGQTSPGEERGNEIGKVVVAQGSVKYYEAIPIGLVNESKESCTDARRTETCAAARHLDASRDL